MTRTIGILVYDDVEVLDFAGPYEVFTTASRVARRRARVEPAPFEVRLVAEARVRSAPVPASSSSPTTPSRTTRRSTP